MNESSRGEGTNTDCELLPLSSRTLACVLAHLRQPARLDPLAARIHALFASSTALECSSTALLHTLANVANAVCQEQEPTDQTDGTVGHQLLKQLLTQLPSLHATLLHSQLQERLTLDGLAQRHLLPAPMARLYVSQARALIRSFAVAPPCASDPSTIVINREELLTAQRAAEWLCELAESVEPLAGRFRSWLLERPLCLREFLLAAGWEHSLKAAYDRAGAVQ